jgi:hypothetical protein
MTNTPSLAQEQERLRQMAAQELRTARSARSDVLYNPFSNQADRAQANQVWYQAIRKAASDQILTPREIQTTAILSRQRYHQIVRSLAPAPTQVQLPETDV